MENNEKTLNIAQESLKPDPHLGHRKRLRQRITENLGKSSSVDVLEAFLSLIVPRKDTRQTAIDLLERHNGSILQVVQAAQDEQKEGITNYQSSFPQLFAIFKEMCRYCGTSNFDNVPEESGQEAQSFREKLANKPSECNDLDVLKAYLSYVVPQNRLDYEAERLLQNNLNSLRKVIDAGMCRIVTSDDEYTSEIPILFAIFKELRRRYDISPVSEKDKILGNSDIFELAREHFKWRPFEEVWVAMLDSSMRLILWKQMGTGGISSAYINISEVLRECLVQYAKGIILVHNHPGGNLTPSDVDISLTKRLMKSAELVGVQVLEHLIITDKQYYGLFEHGIVSYK